MAGIVKPVYRAEVAWEQSATGLFQIGSSLLGGPDTFAASGFDETFDGPHDNVSDRFKSARIQRGRNDGGVGVLKATATVEIRDAEGKFNPDNDASPLHGIIGQRLHPIRITARYLSVDYGRFYGWVRRARHEPSKRQGVTKLECQGFTLWLERANPVIAPTGPTTTGDAIGLILDDVGWTNQALRQLDRGDDIPNFTADGTQSALELIDELLVAERGFFFITGGGVARYADRHFHARHLSAGTIANVMRAVAPGFDADEAQNRARVTRTGGVLQEHVDDDSRRRWGYSDVPEITTPYLMTDGQALGLAKYLVMHRAQPRSTLWGLTISNRTSALLTQILARELFDMLTVEEAEGGTATGDYHIENIEEEIAPPRHTVSYALSKAPTTRPFMIGRSVIGGPDVLVY